MVTVNAIMQVRRDTAANFASENAVYAEGEILFETDTRKIKVGDGVTAYSGLGFSTVDMAGVFRSYSDLIADTSLTYTSGLAGSVAAGDYIMVAGGRMEVAASGASDHHATTAGGVKLYEAGPNFSTRARAAAWIARGGTAADGTVISWPGASAVAETGATLIGDMAGWVPFSNTPTKPFVLLCLGQSNMRSDTGATGGNYQLYPHIFVREGDGETLGNTWTTPEVGEFPFDQTSDGINYANSYPYGIAREIHERTGRHVCLIIVAKGSHPAVAFVTPSGRTANGWSLDPSFTDLSQAMYPGIADALSSVGSSQVDAVCIHQGEADKADFDTWVAQWSVVFDELEAAGVYNRTDTRVTIGAMTDCPANSGYRIAQFEAALTLSALHLLDNAAYVDANKLPIVAASQLHFTGDGLVALARRTADKLLGPRLPFESWKIDGSIGPSGDITMEIADAKTGGNVSATALNGVYQIERRMIWDAGTGRAVGIGGDVQICVNCDSVDTTGLTSGNTLYLRGLPVPCRNGTNSLFYGSADALHINIGDGIVPAIVGSGASEILFRKLATGAASAPLTVADLTSGSAKLRVQIDYAAKVGTIAYL